MAQGILRTAQGLNASMEALAALGALLRIRQEALIPDPVVLAKLEEVVHAIDPEMLGSATPQEAAATLGMIRAFFAQAADLLADPGRVPGWVFEDPAILQAQGIASRAGVRTMAALAGDDPDFAALLRGQRQFLDIGTGVGQLAIEAALTWPEMQVTGIDVFEPALELARRNLAASQVGERIELRRQSVADVEDVGCYDVIWFPGPFIPRVTVESAMPRLKTALKPGGALLFGFYGGSTSLAEALADLRALRAGGHPWSASEIAARLASAGFERMRVFAPQSLVSLVIGYGPSG